ncbi:MAG: hypothetical protein ABJK59_10485 [Erythrobacter sp.]|uniref:hypothetical protein n=1 Tax=Erythrobacter sp. TaxID=1042 RepID=UPI003297396F
MFLLALAIPGAGPGSGEVSAQSEAAPAVEAQQVKRASAIDPGFGGVIISIRSELYLEEPLDVYFLREGGKIANPSDVFRFGRKQSFFAFGNSTVKYQVRAYQLPVGTYRMVAHGIDCPKIPAQDERCLIDRRGLTGTVEVSRPSRGYDAIAPTFEVREGTLTNAGDFALTARNTVEWSAIPPMELSKVGRRFRDLPSGPEPVIPEGFALKFGLFPRSFEDDRGRRY